MQDELMNKICVRIKAIRDAEGRTQEEFADAIGTTKTTISMWENDEVDPTRKGKKQLENILSVYNISRSFLYEGKGEMKAEIKPTSAVDAFVLRQLELKDKTIATLERTVNHLLSLMDEPGKPKGSFVAPVYLERLVNFDKVTEKDTYLHGYAEVA